MQTDRERGRSDGSRPLAELGRRWRPGRALAPLATVPAMIAALVLPVLCACSSSSSSTTSATSSAPSDYATGAYPSQSLSDYFKNGTAPATEHGAGMPPPPSTAAAGPPPAPAYPGAPATVASAPAPAAAPESSDPAATAYPYPQRSIADMIAGRPAAQ